MSTEKSVVDTKIELGDGSKHAETIKLDGDVQFISHGHLQRLPAPSNDPNDPLNFSTIRKIGILVVTCWFSIFSITSLSALGAILGTLFQLFGADHTPTEIVGLSTYPTMVMAVGALFLLPVAFVVGRRPVFLGVILVCFISYITAATSNTFNGQLISRLFADLATGTTESLLPLILADISFLDQRGLYFGIYWSVQNIISSVVLIGLPYLVAATSWRWFYWFFTIMMGCSIPVAVFALPETRYSRPAKAISGRTIFTDEFGHTHIMSNDEALEVFGITANDDEEVAPPKKSLMQELRPYNSLPKNAFKIWATAFVKIGKAATSPAVLFSLALASIVLGTGIAVTLVYSVVLEQSYHWSPGAVGLFNVGVIPASFISMFYTGFIGDRMNIWLAKRNGGVHKPEHLLWQLVFPTVTVIVGLVAIALPADRPQDYSYWGMVIGWAIFQFGFVCILIVTTTFAAEAVPESPGAGMVVVVAGKNLVSFGASQGIVPMVSKFSYLTAFMILLGILCGIALLGIPVYFLNKKWRSVAAVRVDEGQLGSDR